VDTRPSPTPTRRFWIVDGIPFIATIAAVWAKVVYASLALPTEHWSGVGGPGDVLWALWSSPVVGLGTLALLLALFAPLALAPREWRMVALLLANIGLTALVITDVLHVRFYGDVASVETIGLVPTLLEFLPIVTALLRPADVLYVLEVVVLALFVLVCPRLFGPVPPLPAPHRRRLAAAAGAGGVALALPLLGLVWREGHHLFSPAAVRIDTATAVGILPYHLAETVLRLGRPDQAVTEADLEHLHRHLSERRAPPSPLDGVARGRNVIVISAESLQSFVIGLEVAGQAITPNLSAFARKSLHFVNIYDQTHLGTTADAEFMVMQSLYPLSASVVASDYNGNRFHGLPAILADRGYTTLAACAAPGSFWEMERMHPRLGFQKLYYEDRYGTGERIGPWLADQPFFDETLGMLAGQPEPFMAFLLSASSHQPFRIPIRHRQLRLGHLEGTVLGDYLHSAHYFDAAFGRFVAGLENTGLLDRTVVVVYGDHQGFLGDPPALAELLGYTQRDTYRRLVTRKKVPLLIRLPRGELAGVQRATGGQVDVAPTVLSLLGVDSGESVLLGQDLTRGEDALVVFRDGSFVDGTHHSVRRIGGFARFTCYEVETGVFVDCVAVKDRHRAARERLEVSDAIVRGDLIPTLSARARAAPSHGRQSPRSRGTAG
jgi:phosphoglycerol transferase MdoB-like AlkP superfamily enzyme